MKTSLVYYAQSFLNLVYSVRHAQEARSALVHAASVVPDIVICDLHLPGMPGAEVLTILRRKFPEVLLVAMSGSSAGAIPSDVTADAFYEKGKAPGSLLEILANLASRSHTVRVEGSRLAS